MAMYRPFKVQLLVDSISNRDLNTVQFNISVH